VKSLQSLPGELVEHICSYLAVFDIGRLEQVCKPLKTNIQDDTRIWRKESERLQRRFRCPLARAMMKHMKTHQITDYRYFKIIIGIMAHTKVVVADLEKMALEYKSVGEQEMDQYRSEHMGNMTERSFNLWFKRIVRVFIQEQLMRAKIDQILNYTNEMEIKSEEDGEDEVREKDSKAFEERVAQLFADSPPMVMQKIRDYETWIRRVFKPSDAEILSCAQVKSGHVMDTVRELIMGVHHPEEEEN